MSNEPVNEKSVWKGADFHKPRGWVHQLNTKQIEEILDRAEQAKKAGLEFYQMEPEHFPLKSMKELIERVDGELHGFPGFAVISGLPVKEMSQEQCMLAYGCIMSNFGVISDQTHAGDMSVDVKDAGLEYTEYSRAYHSHREIEFHTDGASLTSLMCLGEALRGGASVLVSSKAIYDEIKDKNPELLEVLFAGSHHHRRGEEGPGEKPYSETRIPVFSVYDGLLQCTFDYKQILWAHDAGAPVLSNEVQALQLLNDLAKKPEFQLHMNMQLGDIQIVNNFTILHARTDYEDGEGKKRHLVRLWLETPNGPRKGRTVRELYVRTT